MLADIYAEPYASLQLWGTPLGADDWGAAEESAAASCQVRASCSRLGHVADVGGCAQFWQVCMSAVCSPGAVSHGDVQAMAGTRVCNADVGLPLGGCAAPGCTSVPGLDRVGRSG